MVKFKRFIKRVRNLALVMLIVGWQTAFALYPIISTQTAKAAPVCINDTAGANDEPGQKDLTRLCIDEANLPTSEHVTWNWDETGTNGANTLDGCALFDTDGDGNINYSVCVTTTGDPATLQSTTLYSCGDDKVDRCTSPVTPLTISNGTSCSVSQQNTDPFPAGAAYPKDTEASCDLYLADVGGVGVAKLIDVCSYPSAQPNSDPSDCVIIRPKAGKLEVRKKLDPISDPGLFNLKIDSTTYATNVGDGGTTGEVVVSEGDHVALETAGTNTSLTSYDTHFECRDLNGTGSVVASGDRTGVDSRQITVPVADGSDIVCIITNSRQKGTITLIKNVINDNGGTATPNDFGLTIDGNGVSSGQTVTLDPGNHSIDENGLFGYQFVSVTGDGCPTQLDDDVVLQSGQNVTCTITNDDVAPELTVIKHVVNDNGGNATAGDFTMNVTGDNVSSPSFPGDENGTKVTLDAGAYSVDENLYAGYEKTLGADCSGSIAVGEKKTCTVTNDDIAPKLTITKVVTNDDGGTLQVSDFSLDVSGTSVDSGLQYTTFDAGVYLVGELQQPGYTLEGFTGDCLADGSITLQVGGVYSCTLTNNDQPAKITVTKVVVNDNGGTATVSDFNLYVGATQVVSGVTNTFSANQQYIVSETPTVNGYTQTDLVCIDANSKQSVGSTFTPANGQEIECTVTNNDNGPKLTLNKVVVNDNGGAASESDWTLSANGPTPISGPGAAGSTDVVSGAGFSAGTYDLSESTGPSGYSASNWVCLGGQQNGSQITISLGDDVTCTITNDDIAPELTVIKHVVNDNGGNATAGDFTMNVTGTNVSNPSFSGDENGTKVTLDAGAYSVDENLYAGYEKTLGADCSGSIAVGEKKTCTVTNDDIQPKLTVVKELGDLFGNTSVVGDFNLYVNLLPVLSGQTNGFDAGNYIVSEDNLPGFKTPIFTGDCDANGNVTLELADDKTCTITNNAEQPMLKVIKHVVNDNGGSAVSSDFTMNVTGTNVSSPSFPGNESGTNVSLNEGSFSVDEDAFNGYAKSFSGDCSGTIKVGETKTCTITNDDIAPTLKLVKEVENRAGSNAAPSDWTLSAKKLCQVGDSSPNCGFSDSGDSSTFHSLLAGTNYNLWENGPSGYTASDWNCDGGSLSGAKIKLSVGENVTCTITNTKDTGYIRVNKKVTTYDDKGLFNLNISDYPGYTASDVSNGGSTGKQEVVTGTYKVSETAGTNTTLDDYISSYVCKNSQWQTVASGNATETETLTVNKGDDITCTFTNHHKTALSIEKYNDKPNPVMVGDTVKYTLIVSVPSNSSTIYDAVAIDVLPDGFEYVPGSWTSSAAATIDPEITGQQLVWKAGNIAPGEIVTITYEAKVLDTVSPGTYTNTAFAQGYDNRGCNEQEFDEELSLLTNRNYCKTICNTVNSEFVESNVTVIAPAVLGEFTAGNVLALVDTGQQLLGIQFIIPSLLLVITVLLGATSRRAAKKGAK